LTPDRLSRTATHSANILLLRPSGQPQRRHPSPPHPCFLFFTAMPSSAQDIGTEMQEFGKFMQALRTNGTADAQLEATRSAMVRSLAGKINCMRSTNFGDGAIVTAGIGRLVSDGWIDAEQQELLTTALVNRLQDASAGSLADATPRRTPQTCLAADAYLTDEMWARLHSATSVQAAICYIRDFMHKLGLVCPSEHTLKVLTAIVLCTGQSTELPGEQKFDVFKQVKAVFAAGRPVSTGLPHLLNYPATPDGLDPRLYHNAYGNTEPPVLGNTPSEYHVAAVARTVPARTSNVQVRDKVVGNRESNNTEVAVQRALMSVFGNMSGFRGRGTTQPHIEILGSARRIPSQSSLASDGSTPRQKHHAIADRSLPDALLDSPESPPPLATRTESILEQQGTRAHEIRSSVGALLAGPRVDHVELSRMQSMAAAAGAAASAAASDDAEDEQSQTSGKKRKKGCKKRSRASTPHTAMKRPAACVKTEDVAACSGAGAVTRNHASPECASKPPSGCTLRVEWSRGQIVAISRRPIGGQTQKCFKFSQHGGAEGARAAATSWLK